MSNSEIMSAVSEMVSYIKERAKIDIATATQKGMIELSNDQAKKIGNIVEASIETNFIKAVSQVEQKLKG